MATGVEAEATKPRRRSPIKRSRALEQEVLDRIAAGERWSKIAGTGNLPTNTVIYKWAQQDSRFCGELALAKQVGADARADKVLDIAEAATKETVSIDRMHIGALKWHVERDDKRYGAVVDEPDLGAGRVLTIVVRRFERYTDDDGVVRVREIARPPEDGRA